MISTSATLVRFPDVKVVMVSDLDVAAEAQAAKYGVPRFGNTDELLTDSEVEIVVNLTIPAVHAAVSSEALRAGKHVWSEKPLSVDRESGRALLEDAESAGRLLGIAPDTIMGAGVQTAKRAIDRGDIGVPLSVTALFQFRGPDSFHPNPGFLFERGAGPLFDIGPYYLTTFAYIFGSISDVAAIGQRARDVRRYEVGPQAGLEFQVDVPTEVRALLRFESGATGQLLLSWDSPFRRMGFLEVTGTEGTIALRTPTASTATHASSMPPTTNGPCCLSAGWRQDEDPASSNSPGRAARVALRCSTGASATTSSTR